MNVTITDTRKSTSDFYLSAECGKITAVVAIHNYGMRVICQNASHKVWGGCGRFFPNAAEALKSYKRPEMKAIINAAVSAHNQASCLHA